MKKFATLALLPILAIGLSACGGEKDEHGMSETEAKSVCLTMAQESIGRNSDADWQNSYDVLTNQIADGWWVQGEVAAPNSMGGKVPSTYSCRIVWDEEKQDHVVSFDGIQPKQ